LNRGRYKDKKAYFKISIKLWIFWTPYQPISKKYFILFSDFYFKKLISALGLQRKFSFSYFHTNLFLVFAKKLTKSYENNKNVQICHFSQYIINVRLIIQIFFPSLGHKQNSFLGSEYPCNAHNVSSYCVHCKGIQLDFSTVLHKN
jgi:hypothetical protein